jgi:hypothetical protein
MWTYSRDFNEYNDQMQDNKNHMGGFDPIGAKISRDRTDF